MGDPISSVNEMLHHFPLDVKLQVQIKKFPKETREVLEPDHPIVNVVGNDPILTECMNAV